jgi:hypothetical protein
MGGTDAVVAAQAEALGERRSARNPCKSLRPMKMGGLFEGMSSWYAAVIKTAREPQFDEDFRHFSLIPTAQAVFLLPRSLGCGGERCPGCFVPAPACCQQTSSNNTTQRTTHFRFRQR